MKTVQYKTGFKQGLIVGIVTSALMMIAGSCMAGKMGTDGPNKTSRKQTCEVLRETISPL